MDKMYNPKIKQEKIMKAFVNFLSLFRIFAAFAIIPMLMHRMYWCAAVFFILGSASDFFDGYLAKKYNAISKLGGVLDHMGDKFLVANALILLAVMMPVWFIVVPVIIMIARELYISGLREFLGTQKIEMPVPKSRFSMGKIKTTLQMAAISGFLLTFAIGSSLTPSTTSKIIFYIIYALPLISMTGLWFAMAASLWSAAEYTMDFANKFKKIK
jgi:CDP-diacylglycerol--glycerol-3-phosphate 3-phosphatidyltransferase